MSLDPVAQRWRCLVLTAGPGYGKTAALRAWLPAGATRWLEPDEVAAAAVGALPSVSTSDGWLVLDDLPELTDQAADELLRWIDGLPGRIRVALTTRWPLPPGLARWRGRGVLGQIGPAELALPVERIAAVLRDDHDQRDPWLPTHLRALTHGWPALVRLAAESLAARPPASGAIGRAMGAALGGALGDTFGGAMGGAVGDRPPGTADALLAVLAGPRTPVSQYVIDEVLAGLPGDAARLVLDLATFDPVSPELAEALGHDAGPLEWLVQTGIAGEPTEAGGRHRLVPLVAAVAATVRPRTGRRALAHAAAAWYAEQGPPLAAARAYHEAGEPESCREMLAEHGDAILATGGAAGFVTLAEALPPGLRDPRLRLRWGDALRIIGDVPAALAVFDELSANLDILDSDPGLAWRKGLAHYLRADLPSALAALGRAGGDGRHAADEVFVHAWTSTTHWMRGDAEAAVAHAARARDLALLAGDDRSLAAAHIASAMAIRLTGDVAAADEHYAQALRMARRAGDLGQVTRILVNQSHELLARARYPQAVATAGAAVTSAEAAGPAGMLVVAMCNEGEALGRIGLFDEAVERFNRVVAMCERMGLRRTAGALVGLGDVHRRRGWPEQARAAYQAALAISRVSGELQVLVPALAGLARVHLSELPEPSIVEAATLAEEAAQRAAGPLVLPAWLAQGWVALAAGDPATARSRADETAAEARRRQEPGYLAEALELRAASEVDLDAIRAALVAANEVWSAAGATVDSDRVLATLGALPDAGTEARLAGTLARQRQARAGIRPPATALALAGPVDGGPLVRIQVLGRFDVRVGGQSVPATAWQSRKARDLLRILVARRGRVMAREELAELLWPDEPGGRTGHRLSVLLSLVRGVLDPGRSGPADRFVLADKSGVALDPTWIQVDVETFLSDVDNGCRLYEQGEESAARAVLDAARREYQGDPFDDEPYGDCGAALRELARAAYLRAVRTLARLARQHGDTDDAVAHLLSLLERDPYDEDAHRSLVAILTAAARHGEARRAAERYREAMAAIGILHGADEKFQVTVNSLQTVRPRI